MNTGKRFVRSLYRRANKTILIGSRTKNLCIKYLPVRNVKSETITIRTKTALIALNHYGTFWDRKVSNSGTSLPVLECSLKLFNTETSCHNLTKHGNNFSFDKRFHSILLFCVSGKSTNQVRDDNINPT